MAPIPLNISDDQRFALIKVCIIKSETKKKPAKLIPRKTADKLCDISFYFFYLPGYVCCENPHLVIFLSANKINIKMKL